MALNKKMNSVINAAFEVVTIHQKEYPGDMNYDLQTFTDPKIDLFLIHLKLKGKLELNGKFATTVSNFLTSKNLDWSISVEDDGIVINISY